MRSPRPGRSTFGRAAALFLAAALILLALPALGAARTGTGLPANSSLLFALNGKGGRLESIGKPRRHEYKLTLSGVDKDVLWFADRPRRDAGRLSAPGFFGDWGRLGFRKTAPNAALVVAGAKAGEDTMAVALRLRRYDRGTRTATFTARALGSVGGGLRHLEKRLDARVPSQFRDASLFVDNGEFLSACIDSRPELVAVEASTLWQNFQELVGFVPTEGQRLAIDQDEALYSLIGNSFEEGFNPTSFVLPAMKGPASTSWNICTNGIYPAEGELGGAILGEVAFFPESLAGRANRNWLPADGRQMYSGTGEYAEYDQKIAGSAVFYQLPNVPAPVGMKAMVAMEPGTVPDTAVGQIRMFVGEPPEKETEESAAVEWAPAEGQTVSAKEYPGLANLVAGGAESKATQIKLPAVPSPAPGVRWFVSMSGAWPLHSL